MTATRAFFGYVDEVGQMLALDGKGPSWLVRVREGSSLIGVEPAPSTPIEVVRAIYAQVQSGVERLAEGDIEAAGLNESALRLYARCPTWPKPTRKTQYRFEFG